MNIKNCEEILSRYEGKIDQKKIDDWIFSLSDVVQDPDDPLGIRIIVVFVKTKEEIIADLIKYGLNETDAIELESSLQMSKGENYSKGQDLPDNIREFTDMFSLALEEALEEFDNELEDLDEDGEKV